MKPTEINFEDNKIILTRGKNNEFIISQENSKTGEIQKIVIKEKEMVSLIKKLELQG